MSSVRTGVSIRLVSQCLEVQTRMSNMQNADVDADPDGMLYAVKMVPFQTH